MRTVILFIVALVCMNANAQNYKSMLPDGRVWKIVSPGNGTNVKDLCYTETICGDIIVAGRTCKRVHIFCTTPEESWGLRTDYYIALFEENGKLYEADSNSNSNGNGKILDFSIHEGDQISNNKSTVMCEDYIEVRGRCIAG